MKSVSLSEFVLPSLGNADNIYQFLSIFIPHVHHICFKQERKADKVIKRKKQKEEKKKKRRRRRREKKNKKSQKRQVVSGTRCPYVSICGCVMVRGAAAPKGPMTYAKYVLRLQA